LHVRQDENLFRHRSIAQGVADADTRDNAYEHADYERTHAFSRRKKTATRAVCFWFMIKMSLSAAAYAALIFQSRPMGTPYFARYFVNSAPVSRALLKASKACGRTLLATESKSPAGAVA
jgi:hypothetical protein